MSQPARRQQHAITIRSDRAFERLNRLMRGGKSQVAIIEEALDRMPLPPADDVDARRARIDAILASVPSRPYPTMAEIDGEMYDDHGLPR